jgi:hypothetical protein
MDILRKFAKEAIKMRAETMRNRFSLLHSFIERYASLDFNYLFFDGNFRA